MKYKVSLISPEEIKASGLVDKNVLEPYLISAIETAQDISLRQLIGNCLYDSLRNETLVLDKSIMDELLYDVKKFLVYQVVADLVLPLTFKNRNAGVIQANDVNYGTNPIDDVQHISTYWKLIATSYGKILTDFIDENNILKEDKCCTDKQINYDCGLNIHPKKRCGKC